MTAISKVYTASPVSEPTGNHAMTSRNFSLDIGGRCQLWVTAQSSIVEALGNLLTVCAPLFKAEAKLSYKKPTIRD